ncbi:MAG: hypothetical protein H8E47_14340 [Anaerolineales bacterium]|nr:hypothetical protein [Anaerolineales bacterium]
MVCNVPERVNSKLEIRWALLGSETAPGPIVLVSALVAVGLLISGAYYFRRMEKTFADVV